MKNDIKITQEVVIFPENKQKSATIEQQVLICDNQNWVNVFHDDWEISLSMHNFKKLYDLFGKALIKTDAFTSDNQLIFDEINKERIRQYIKFGEQNSPCLDQTLLNRENSCTPQRMCEEYEIPSESRAKQLCDSNFQNNRGTYAHIAVEEMSEIVSSFDPIKRREEVIQLAAVCVAWVQKIDRDLTTTNNKNNNNAAEL